MFRKEKKKKRRNKINENWYILHTHVLLLFNVINFVVVVVVHFKLMKIKFKLNIYFCELKIFFFNQKLEKKQALFAM